MIRRISAVSSCGGGLGRKDASRSAIPPTKGRVQYLWKYSNKFLATYLICGRQT